MSSYTRIQLIVEIEGSTYGPDWKLSDIQKQARDESIYALRNQFKEGARIKIIGEPKVLTYVDMEEGARR